jgi:hypothetical protein
MASIGGKASEKQTVLKRRKSYAENRFLGSISRREHILADDVRHVTISLKTPRNAEATLLERHRYALHPVPKILIS